MTKGCCSDSNVIKPNELNRKITIQKVMNAVDPEGIPIEEWTNVATLWSNRKPLSGREYFEAAAINAEKTIKYRIRYRRDILPNMRIFDVLDGKYYSIKAVLDDYYGDRTQTHLMCELIEDG